MTTKATVLFGAHAALAIVLGVGLAGCSSASPLGSSNAGNGSSGASGGEDASTTALGATGASSTEDAGGAASSSSSSSGGGASGSDDGGTAPTSGGDAGGGAASAARQAVLAFLASTTGKASAIGVEDKDSSNPTADSDTMASMAGDGQSPSFWSADWGFGSDAVDNREGVVQEGEKQWAQGAVVQYIYHACPLTMNELCQWTDIDGSYGSLSDAQWSDLTTAGGTLNKAWLARLDTIGAFFLELKAAGVAPLFRPLHEINGAWAWWQGRPGPTGSAKLYQITHDYLVNVKGLDNIIWVWNVQDYTTLASDVTVYTPGASYFDVAALDVYDTGYTSGNYQAMLGAANGKPIGVAECQFLPSVDVLSQQPKWAYVAMWPDFFSSNTSSIPALFGDSQVLTLSKMPGWTQH